MAPTTRFSNQTPTLDKYPAPFLERTSQELPLVSPFLDLMEIATPLSEMGVEHSPREKKILSREFSREEKSPEKTRTGRALPGLLPKLSIILK